MKRLRPKKGFAVTVFFFYLGIRLLIGGMIYDETGIFMALGAWGISFLLFLTVGGFKGETQMPFEDSPKYRECCMGMVQNLEASLEREKANKERYYSEQRDSNKTALEGAGSFLGGVLINLISTGIDNWISPGAFLPILPLGHLAGCYVEYFGLTWMFRAYLYSGMIFAKEISEMFMQRTTSVKIEECSKMIAVIQRKLREREEG